MGHDGQTLGRIYIKCLNGVVEWQDLEVRRGKSEYAEGTEQESRNKSESSLVLDNLTIQCYASSVRFDVFSTLSKTSEGGDWHLRGAR